MKLQAKGDSKQKRVTRIVLEAETRADEAVLYAKYLELKEETPKLASIYQDVLDLVEEGIGLASEISDALDVPLTAMNNRLAHLKKMGLIEREKVAAPAGGRRFIYRISSTEQGDA